MGNTVYLDNHTITRPCAQAMEQMFPFYKEYWGTVSAPHRMGQELIPLLNQRLKSLYQYVGADAEDQFLLTSSGAEGIAHIFQSTYLDFVRETGRNHFLTTPMEEAPIGMSINRLEKLGCSGKTLPVNSFGQLTRQALEEAIKPRSGLLSLSWANGLTGVIHPISDLAAVCKEKEVRFHVDASYAIGKVHFQFQELGADFLSFDGPLLYAPKGTGGLFIKKGVAFSPLIVGDSGINAPGLAALEASLGHTLRHFDHFNTEIVRLRDRLEKGIREGFADAFVFFEKADRLPNCSAIGFPGIACEALLFALHRQGIYASMGGGHCQKLSCVLTACGVDSVLAGSALSFSLSCETTEEEIDYAVERIVETAKKLRRLSC